MPERRRTDDEQVALLPLQRPQRILPTVAAADVRLDVEVRVAGVRAVDAAVDQRQRLLAPFDHQVLGGTESILGGVHGGAARRERQQSQRHVPLHGQIGRPLQRGVGLRRIDVGHVDPGHAVLGQAPPPRRQAQRDRRIVQKRIGSRSGPEPAGGRVGLAAEQNHVGAEVFGHLRQGGRLGGRLHADEGLVVKHSLADPRGLQCRARGPFGIAALAHHPRIVVRQAGQRRQRPPARQHGGHANADLAGAGQPRGAVHRLRAVAARAPSDEDAERAMRHADLLGTRPGGGAGWFGSIGARTCVARGQA